MPKTYTATASGPANPNAVVPKKGFFSLATAPLAEVARSVIDKEGASRALAARKKKQQDENLSYKEKLIAAARAPAGMKKGGAVKKKVTVKAKPVVKAKARKK
jgi:hypothetical protein